MDLHPSPLLATPNPFIPAAADLGAFRKALLTEADQRHILHKGIP